MLSIIIPTYNIAPSDLLATLKTCQPFDDVVQEIMIVDGGSDANPASYIQDAFAQDYKAGRIRVSSAPTMRSIQLYMGAKAAMGDWFLFLHADTHLGAGWQGAVRHFIKHHPAPEDKFDKRSLKAGTFYLKLRDASFWARLTEWGAALRFWLLGLAYGDQGLLICREHYFATGGHKPIPIMEDVKLIRRIFKRKGRVYRLPAKVHSSAARYQAGYIRRWAKNLLCLLMFYCKIQPSKIRQFYE